MSGAANADDTDDRESSNDVPQYEGQVVFKGDFDENESDE
jgi:hypothetical protein